MRKGERVRREEMRERKRGQWVRGEGGGWRKRRKRMERVREKEQKREKEGEGEKKEIKGMRTEEKTFYTDILHL